MTQMCPGLVLNSYPTTHLLFKILDPPEDFHSPPSPSYFSVVFNGQFRGTHMNLLIPEKSTF